MYEGRLSDRNRSMVVVASRRGRSSRMICSFLDIDNKSCRKYLQSFERGGYTELFPLQIKPNRKFDDEVIKKAIFGLMHEPPSSRNQTGWPVGIAAAKTMLQVSSSGGIADAGNGSVN